MSKTQLTAIEQANIETLDSFAQEYGFAGWYNMLHPKLEEMGYFSAPASANYHGNYEGGLFDHSLCVARTLLDLTENMGLRWQDKRSPVIVGLFHDLCKCDTYFKVSKQPEDLSYAPYVYNEKPDLRGHGEKSVMILASIMRLTEEEVMCIRYHMGAFTPKEEWEYYSRACSKYPNVLWTHTADMVASQVEGV